MASGALTRPPEPAQVDRRSNVTGSYSITGTLRIVSNGETTTGAVEDTLRVANDIVSISSLRLTIGSQGCGPRA